MSWNKAVTRQYTDLLGRTPTATELSAAVGQVSGGAKTVGQIDDGLRRSTENTTNVDPTVRLYRAFLARTPDAGGLKFWIGRRRSGSWSLTKMADSFASSNEFKTKYGSLTNRQFVTRIYIDVLGRTADAAGVDYWTGKLDRKERTRGQVMVGFSESSEYKRQQAENTDVAVAYILLLGRSPSAGEVTTWVTAEEGRHDPCRAAPADARQPRLRRPHRWLTTWWRTPGRPGSWSIGSTNVCRREPDARVMADCRGGRGRSRR